MPQLINDDAQRNETRRDRGSRQTTLFCGYRFAKCFIVDCAFRCKTKESCASRYKLHRTECAELKFLRTRNTKHNSDLRTQSVAHNLLHLVQKIFFSSLLLGCARKEIFVVQRGITNELTAGSWVCAKFNSFLLKNCVAKQLSTDQRKSSDLERYLEENWCMQISAICSA